jgi:hypothetical protein
MTGNVLSATGGAFIPQVPAAVSGDIAIWGSGANAGNVIDTGITIQDVFPVSSSQLWSSSQIENVLQRVYTKYFNSASQTIAASTTTPSPFIVDTVSISFPTSPTASSSLDPSTGIWTVTSLTSSPTMFNFRFSSGRITNPTDSTTACQVRFVFWDSDASSQIGVYSTGYGIPSGTAVQSTGIAVLDIGVLVPGSSSRNFQIMCLNLNPSQSASVRNLFQEGACNVVVQQIA